jgi:hypothetical protein
MRKFRINLRCSAVLALLIGLGVTFVSTLHAQSYYGSIVGTVTDSSGAIVPGATVTLTNKSTNEKHIAKSSSAGDYTFPDLEPAAYSVAVEAASFKRYLRDTVTVEVSTTTRVDAALQVGAVTETVEVNTQAALLQTDSGTLSNEVESQTVQEMPLNGRNVMNLLELEPGVIPTNSLESGSGLDQNSGTSTNPLGWGGGTNGYTINGGDNEEYLDGAPINLLQGSNVPLVPTQDSIQEFGIDSSVNGADQGRASGGVINMITRGGTNQWHGTAYEYFRNADLNANTYFGNAAGAQRPEWNQNLYGLNLGLPIKKDKVFFFGSWEADTIITGIPTSSNEPTLAMQNGVFNGAGITGGARLFYDPTQNCNIQPYTGQVVNGQTFAAGGYYIANLYQAGLKSGTCGDPTGQILKTYWAELPDQHQHDFELLRQRVCRRPSEPRERAHGLQPELQAAALPASGVVASAGQPGHTIPTPERGLGPAWGR